MDGIEVVDIAHAIQLAVAPVFLLSGIGVLVMPRQLAVPRAHEGIDDATQARLRGVVDALVDTVARLHA